MSYRATFGYQLHALTYSVDVLAEETLRAHSDLSFPQFLVILCAVEHPGESLAFASEWVQISQPTMTYMTKRLSDRGYIRVDRDEQDKRAKRLWPTELGKETIAHLYPLLESALTPHLETLSPADLEAMLQSMQALFLSITSRERNENDYE